MCGKTQDLKRLCNIILSKFFTLFLILCYFSNAVVTPLKSNFFQRSLLQCGFIFVSLIKKKKKKRFCLHLSVCMQISFLWFPVCVHERVSVWATAKWVNFSKHRHTTLMKRTTSTTVAVFYFFTVV